MCQLDIFFENSPSQFTCNNRPAKNQSTSRANLLHNGTYCFVSLPVVLPHVFMNSFHLRGRHDTRCFNYWSSSAATQGDVHQLGHGVSHRQSTEIILFLHWFQRRLVVFRRPSGEGTASGALFIGRFVPTPCSRHSFYSCYTLREKLSLS